MQALLDIFLGERQKTWIGDFMTKLWSRLDDENRLSPAQFIGRPVVAAVFSGLISIVTGIGFLPNNLRFMIHPLQPSERWLVYGFFLLFMFWVGNSATVYLLSFRTYFQLLLRFLLFPARHSC
jgi:hypothetical protein